MDLQTKTGLRLLILLIGIAALFAGIDRYRYRFVRSDPDLLKLLPAGDATVFYARVDLLRRAGMLNLVTDAKSPDADYQAFVRATRFDYRKDVDVIAGSITDQAAFVVVKGHFDWDRIEKYARNQGGYCRPDTCDLNGNSPGNWISLVRIQPNVMGIAVGKEKSLSRQIHVGQQAMTDSLPGEPVWVKVAPHLLRNPSSVPVGLRIFLISLQPANSVVIALGPAPASAVDAAFEIKLGAQCRSSSTADTVRKQLEIDTRMLKLELTHEHQQPNPADLTGLLTSGTFDTSGKEVRGYWPVRKELLKALQ